MARSQRQVPNVYFGAPGKLVTLPYPLGSIDRTADRQTFDFVTGSGLHQISQLTESSRAYTLNWNALHQDTFTNLEMYRLGANGPGPFAYIDPSAPNLLPANVAASTGLYSDATDLVTQTLGGTASSNSDGNFIHRTTGYRSIKWTFTELNANLIAVPLLAPRSPFRNWGGIPVMTGLPYIFSSWARVDGTIETAANLIHQLQWLDSTGAVLSTTASSTTSVTSTWVRLSVTANAPANAAYVVPRWASDKTTITQNGAFYLDEPLLEQDSVVNNWAPGTGVRPVQMVGLTEPVPFEARFRTNIQLGLREMTR